MRYATIRALSSRLIAVILKEVFTVALLIPVSAHTGIIDGMGIFILALSDFIFTSIALLSSIIVYRLAKEHTESDIRIVVNRSNGLVSGTDEGAFLHAREIEAEGKFNILGLITDKPDDDGMVVGDYVVYYAKTREDLQRLSWRLGGVDCIFFPRTDADVEMDADGGQEVVHNDSMSLFGQFIKRSFDVILSAVLIAVFFPLAILCFVAVKLEDGGPALYKQERVGKNGKVFCILKFRSMRTDAEASGAQLYSGERDPRLTKTGAFLRSHHLDELPQLWNVLRGDMSFVGYRPERQFYIEQIENFNPRYCFLYQIRPGVTSYATLYNGYTDTVEKMLTRLDLDLYYLRHHSIAFDLKVLWLTFFSIISGKKF